MNLKHLLFHVLTIFFILMIVVSGVSAIEFAEDYNLVSHDFNRDGSWSTPGIKINVPSDSNFTLVEEYSGPVKNSDGKGNLSVFVNYGEYADVIPMMILVESDSGNGTLGADLLQNLMKDYKEIDADGNMLILEFNNASEIYYDSESNETGLNSYNSAVSNLSDENSSVMVSNDDDKISYAEPELKAARYAMASITEDGDESFVLFGNDLDLMKDMCKQFYFFM